MFDKCIVIGAETPVYVNTSQIEKTLSKIEHNQKEDLLSKDRVDISLTRYNELLSREKELQFAKSLFEGCGVHLFPYDNRLVGGSLCLYEMEDMNIFADKRHFRLEFDVQR